MMCIGPEYMCNTEEGTETVAFLQNLQNTYNVSTSGCTYIALKIKHFLSRYRQKTKQEFNSKIKSSENGGTINMNMIISSVFKESVFEKVFDHFSEEFNVDELIESQSKQNQTQIKLTQRSSDQIQCHSNLIVCGSEPKLCYSLKSEVTSFGLENSVGNLEFDEVEDGCFNDVPNAIHEKVDVEDDGNKEILPGNKSVQIRLKYEDKLYNLQIDINPNLTLVNLKERICEVCYIPSLDFDLFSYDGNVGENILLEDVSLIGEETELLVWRRNLPCESYMSKLKGKKKLSKKAKCLSSDGTIVMKNKKGNARGSCSLCECNEYTVDMDIHNHNDCDYCSHEPIAHHLLTNISSVSLSEQMNLSMSMDAPNVTDLDTEDQQTSTTASESQKPPQLNTQSCHQEESSTANLSNLESARPIPYSQQQVHQGQSMKRKITLPEFSPHLHEYLNGNPLPVHTKNIYSKHVVDELYFHMKSQGYFDGKNKGCQSWISKRVQEALLKKYPNFPSEKSHRKKEFKSPLGSLMSRVFTKNLREVNTSRKSCNLHQKGAAAAPNTNEKSPRTFTFVGSKCILVSWSVKKK